MRLTSRLVTPLHATAAFSLVALLILATNVPRVLPAGDGRGYWPHQTTLRAAGAQIAQRGLLGPLGSWNAGILRWASGRRDLLNLDGLVNNDILRHARSGTLPDYIDDMGIQHIIDFEVMLSSPTLRARGGYDDPSFLARLEPVQTYVTGAPPPWDRLVVYSVKRRSSDPQRP